MRMNTETISIPRDSAYPAHLGWRIMAIVYDFLPMIPLLFISSIVILLLHGGKAVVPGTFLAYFAMFFYWAVVGCYAVVSWRRGGQTMGMRPWRLMVVDQSGKSANAKALSLRYAVASLSGGLALLWCLIDPQKRGLHDIASGTLLVRKQVNASAGTGKR